MLILGGTLKYTRSTSAGWTHGALNHVVDGTPPTGHMYRRSSTTVPSIPEYIQMLSSTT